MKRSNLPLLTLATASGFSARSFVSPSALARWDSALVAAAKDEEEDRTIGIYDVIGEDWWTGEGFTAKRLAGALRNLGKGPVTVAVNSPGGNFFEGLAMYNMLREHPGDVTVRIMGVAASAASIVAMAGDEVQIARAGFLMIHNTHVVAEGNRHDMREVAEIMEPFDAAMADIYAARTGEDVKAIGKLMDRESWIGGTAAVDQGFADALLASDAIARSEGATAHAASVRRMEAALRASGMSKTEAMRLISEFKSSVGDPAGSGGGGRATVPGSSTEPGDPVAEVVNALSKFSLK